MRTWKEILQDPRIDDSGNYDFYAIDLPENEERWCSNRYRIYKCDTCGRYVRRAFVQKNYFYTIDGYDYLSYTECARCVQQTKREARRRAQKRKKEQKKQCKEYFALLKKKNPALGKIECQRIAREAVYGPQAAMNALKIKHWGKEVKK